MFGKIVLVQADAMEYYKAVEDGRFQLLLTSTPYPGVDGFEDMTGRQYTFQFLPEFLAKWGPKVKQDTGMIVQNIMFPVRKDGWFDHHLFYIPFIYAHAGWNLINPYIWDKLNAPPKGNHDRYDRNAWEFCFAFARTQDYTFNPQRRPYSLKTKGKARTGMRQPDKRGNMAGGHSDLHPDGALLDNVLRMSSSGDQGRPRVPGGSFPRSLAERFILQHTNPGDEVVDPFCGSGTVNVMAQKHGRPSLGIDISPEALDKIRGWGDEVELSQVEVINHDS